LPGLAMPAGLLNSSVSPAPVAAGGLLLGAAPAGASQSEVNAMMVYQNPELASTLSRQAAEQYEQVVQFQIHPEVQEMSHYFNLDERSTRALDTQMKGRKNTFEEDMEALWDILAGARNPSGLLMVKVREMQEGVFRGFSTPERNVAEFARKHKLDNHASAKLAEVLAKRPDPDEDLRKLGKHLERSNKPSALTMLMLKDLRNGQQIKDPEHTAAMGSAAHRKELLKERQAAERRKSRSRSHQRHRSRSRDRGARKRSRSRRQGRGRDRDRRR